MTAFFEEAEDGVGHGNRAGKLLGIVQGSKKAPVHPLES
jgi:hypothetical protein